MIKLSNETDIQETIRVVKELIASEKIEEGLNKINEQTIQLEKNGHYLESIILWQFLADSAEKLEEDELLSYAYAKLITRYIANNEVEKAKEIYDKANSKKLFGFHLDTAKAIFESRSKAEHKKEIVNIKKRDVFGDYVPIISCPNVLFDSLSQIKNYISKELQEGSYLVTVFNHSSNTQEDIEVLTEKTVEYQVLSITERVKIGL